MIRWDNVTTVKIYADYLHICCYNFRKFVLFQMYQNSWNYIHRKNYILTKIQSKIIGLPLSKKLHFDPKSIKNHRVTIIEKASFWPKFDQKSKGYPYRKSSILTQNRSKIIGLPLWKKLHFDPKSIKNQRVTPFESQFIYSYHQWQK